MVRQIRGSTQIMDDSVPPVKISGQGHGGTLDSDMVDGKHASELLAGAAGVGCVRADGSVPLVADWNVGGHQIKWFLFHKGTVFPTTPSPIEGQPFYRTDENKLYVYDGTTWQGVGISITRGPAASKPAAGIADSIYIETDGSYIIWRDNGSSWDEITRAEAGIRLAQLAEKAHASTTGKTTDDHHAEVHALDPDSGKHTGTLPEDEVVLDDATGHDHQGAGSTGKKVTAAKIVNVPAGSIAATDVQGALDELDIEKAGIADAIKWAVLLS